MSRRTAWLRISDVVLPFFFGKGHKSYEITDDPVPADARILDAHSADGHLNLLLESAEFAPVEPGERSPTLRLRVSTLRTD